MNQIIREPMESQASFVAAFGSFLMHHTLSFCDPAFSCTCWCLSRCRFSKAVNSSGWRSKPIV